MYLLSIDLYELGQFLRILLWIALPMVVIVLLVTTYLHYRKKKRSEQEDSHVAGGPVEISLENTGNAYRGLLWMKDKYEEYRDQTDNKLERLKAELARSEQKYLGLLAERGEQKGTLLPVSARGAALPEKTPAPEKPALSEVTVPAELIIPVEATVPAEATWELSLQSNDSQGEDFLHPELVLRQNDSPSEYSPAGENTQDSPAPTNTAEETALRDLVAEKDRQIGFLHVELDQRIKNYHELDYQHREHKVRAEELAAQYLQAQQLLETQQLKLDELNGLLGHEMSKVGDLTGKLENNMRLLLHIHQELDQSLHARQPDDLLPAQTEGQSYEGTMEEAEKNEEGNRESLPSDKQSRETGRDPFPPLTDNTKIVGWIESEEAEV